MKPEFTSIHNIRSILICLLVLSCLYHIEAQDSALVSLFDKSIEELINQEVTIATKSSQKLSETPAIVSVITSEDIKNMGARELEDVLRTIPGFEITRSYGGYYTMGVRGVKDARIPSKILTMIDGTPFNQIFYGSYVNWGYVFNLESIEKIEIIRGPGSALYGRNAFSAVINIITKTGETGEKVLVKTSVGTFDTKSISGFYGFKNKKFNASLAVNKIYTDVTNEKFDEGFGLSNWNLTRDNFSAHTNINYKNFSLSGMYYNLNGGALFTDSKAFNEIINYSLKYKKDISSKLTIYTKFYGHNSNYTEELESLKPNIHPVYPNGIYLKPSSKEYLYGIETELNIKLLRNNNLLFGIQTDVHGVSDVIITANVDSLFKQYPDPIPGADRNHMVLYEPGWFLDNEHQYQNLALFIQDIWYPMEEFGITLGARYDYDSEIGSVLNPRVGFVLEPRKNLNLRLLYGRAYRAPAPADQYVTLGFAVGNRDLKPEIINTYEVGLNFRHNNISHSLSIFNNKLTNMIYAAQLVRIDQDNKYANIGKNISRGIEYENKIFLGKSFYSYFNYAYTNSVNTDFINNNDTVYNHPDIAPHKFNFGVNYLFLKYFKLNFNMFYRSKMSKYRKFDTQEFVQNQIGDYAIFNSNLQINNLIKNLNICLTIFNIFDTKYYAQDSQHLLQPSQPRRQIIASLRYTIK